MQVRSSLSNYLGSYINSNYASKKFLAKSVAAVAAVALAYYAYPLLPRLQINPWQAKKASSFSDNFPLIILSSFFSGLTFYGAKIIRDKTSELRDAKVELEAKARENQGLQTDLAGAQDKLEAARGELKAKARENQGLQTDLAGAQDKLETATKAHQRLQSDLAGVQGELRDDKAYIEKLKVEGVSVNFWEREVVRMLNKRLIHSFKEIFELCDQVNDYHTSEAYGDHEVPYNVFELSGLIAPLDQLMELIGNSENTDEGKIQKYLDEMLEILNKSDPHENPISSYVTYLKLNIKIFNDTETREAISDSLTTLKDILSNPN